MSRRYLLAVAIGVIAGLAGFITGSSALADQPYGDKLVLRRSFDTWAYEVNLIGSQAHLRVSSRINNIAALRTLLSEHRNQQSKLFQSMQSVPVDILLKQPLRPEGLADFVKQSGISVQSYVFIAQDTNGDLVTVFGAPVDGELLPMHILNGMIKSIEERQNTTLTLKGIVSIDATVDSAAFTRVSNDRMVFGIDSSPALALQDLQKQVNGIDVSTVKVSSAPFYWIVAQK